MKFLQIPLVIAIVSASAAAADESSLLSAPVMGCVFDPAARGIRPILGSPGASMIGSPLDLGISVTSAFISPRQDYAIVASAADAAVQILALPPASLPGQVLTSAVSVPRQVVFSPSGMTVGSYQADAAKIQIFTHLPQEPALKYEIHTGALSGVVVSAAITDDGEAALILVADQAGPTVWLSYAGGDPVQLSVPFSAAAVAFRAGGREAAIAATTGQVYLLRSVETGPSFQALAAADDRIAYPNAVQFSADGGRLYLANRRGAIASLDVESGETSFFSCGCKATGLFPLASDGLIRLNEIADGPLFLLGSGTRQARIWFVPAVAPPADSEEGVQ